MQTAVVMKRDLQGVSIRQNSKTGMFNANDLLEAHNLQKPNGQKRLQYYMENNATIEYMDVIKRELDKENSNSYNSSELEFTLVEGKKPESVVKTSRGRVNGGTWMHPYLFIDFAMWLSPELKLQCMKWLSDHLLQFRDEAGDTYKDVNMALSIGGEQRQMVYIYEAKMINGLVFGSDKGGQRNNATEEQLDLLQKLQKADVKLIKKGKSFSQREQILKVLKSLLIE